MQQAVDIGFDDISSTIKNIASVSMLKIIHGDNKKICGLNFSIKVIVKLVMIILSSLLMENKYHESIESCCQNI